jgi:hypothetical protein
VMDFKQLGVPIGGYPTSGRSIDCPSVGFEVATAVYIRVG